MFTEKLVFGIFIMFDNNVIKCKLLPLIKVKNKRPDSYFVTVQKILNNATLLKSSNVITGWMKSYKSNNTGS